MTNVGCRGEIFASASHTCIFCFQDHCSLCQSAHHVSAQSNGSLAERVQDLCCLQSEAELRQLSVAALKSRLKGLRQSQTGRKADLVARLLSAPADSSTQTPTSPPATAIAHVTQTDGDAADRQPSEGLVEVAAVTASEGHEGGGQLFAGAPVPGTAAISEVASAQVRLHGVDSYHDLSCECSMHGANN